MPYYSLSGAPNPEVDLRLVGPTKFKLLCGFRYVDPDDDDRAWVVEDGLETDLASVPFFVQWLVRSYGKHTKAALIHDQYWDFVCNNDKLREVNLVFRDAMREDGVPIVRRWVVWAAVSIAGLTKKGVKGRPRLAAWVLGLVVLLGAIVGMFDAQIPWTPVELVAAALAVAAVAALIVGLIRSDKDDARRKLGLQVATICAVYVALMGSITALSRWGLVRDDPLIVAGGAAVVAAFAALPQWRASAIATGMALLVIVPTTAVFLALAIYGLVELCFYGIRYLKAKVKRERKPAPIVTNTMGRPPA